MRFAAIPVAMLLAVPVAAQDRPPQGIAFAQAEEGTWLCRHEQPLEAMQCARERCAEQSPGQECFTTAWCFPGGWSGYMTIWLADFHTTQVLCGIATEAALTAGFRALCAAEETALTCDLVATIDPDGNERAFEGGSFPGGAPPPPDAAAGSDAQEGGEAADEESPAQGADEADDGAQTPSEAEDEASPSGG